ncbi:alpha/beta fold hydrolase [Paenibacillus sedimenti]|uniref:Alpha/beta fold hydrolase n=1 Tax=Paenibacillus sedimenti TaxID=2770274 RepID=A0A926KQF4_9BACL|nr:alpha/beta fold hydrolase [Paenibacillus sedimenti]
MYIKEREILLYFRAWIPEHPRGVLIFIHGAAEHSGLYGHIGTESMNRQIACMAPDLRGFGQSAGQKGHIHRFQDYLDDLDQLVIQIQKQYPQLSIFLFGHSLGALIVIRYVQRFTNVFVLYLFSFLKITHHHRNHHRHFHRTAAPWMAVPPDNQHSPDFVH